MMTENNWRTLSLLLIAFGAIWWAFDFQDRRAEWHRICRPFLTWHDENRDVLPSRDARWASLEQIADACLNAAGAP